MVPQASQVIIGMARRRFESTMSETEFWAIIDFSRRNTNGSRRKQEANLRRR